MRKCYLFFVLVSVSSLLQCMEKWEDAGIEVWKYEVITILDQYAAQQREKSMFEQLSKNTIETIGSFIKRSGRDTFRCLSKECNKNMWSQDELNNRFILAKKDNDTFTQTLLTRYGAFGHPFLELKDTLKDGGAKLSLVKWFLGKWSANDFYKDVLVITAARVGNKSVVAYFLNSNESYRTMLQGIVIEAAKGGQIEILEYLHNGFLVTYEYEGNLEYALMCAQENKHTATVELLKKHISEKKKIKKY